jgi:hypothetical protein
MVSIIEIVMGDTMFTQYPFNHFLASITQKMFRTSIYPEKIYDLLASATRVEKSCTKFLGDKILEMASFMI